MPQIPKEALKSNTPEPNREKPQGDFSLHNFADSMLNSNNNTEWFDKTGYREGILRLEMPGGEQLVTVSGRTDRESGLTGCAILIDGIDQKGIHSPEAVYLTGELYDLGNGVGRFSYSEDQEPMLDASVDSDSVEEKLYNWLDSANKNNIVDEVLALDKGRQEVGDKDKRAAVADFRSMVGGLFSSNEGDVSWKESGTEDGKLLIGTLKLGTSIDNEDGHKDISAIIEETTLGKEDNPTRLRVWVNERFLEKGRSRYDYFGRCFVYDLQQGCNEVTCRGHSKIGTEPSEPSIGREEVANLRSLLDLCEVNNAR